MEEHLHVSAWVLAGISGEFSAEITGRSQQWRNFSRNFWKVHGRFSVRIHGGISKGIRETIMIRVKERYHKGIFVRLSLQKPGITSGMKIWSNWLMNPWTVFIMNPRKNFQMKLQRNFWRKLKKKPCWNHWKRWVNMCSYFRGFCLNPEKILWKNSKSNFWRTQKKIYWKIPVVILKEFMEEFLRKFIDGFLEKSLQIFKSLWRNL